MSNKIKFGFALAAMIVFTGAMSFAQSGEATYKAKCQSCHGAEGVPSPGIAKAFGVKPATDPAVKKMSEAEMIAAVRSGTGKMKAVAGLSDAQVKESVDYFRTFAK